MQAGALAVHAVSTSVIDALTIGGSISASIGSSSGAFTFSGAGSGSGNFVYNTVESYIDKRVLFSTTAHLLVRQLNGGVVSDDLRDAFEAQDFKLSDNLLVNSRADGWEVIDLGTPDTNGDFSGGVVYAITNDNGTLRIVKDRTFLFNTPETNKIIAHLNGGTVWVDLTNAFTANGITLSTDVKVERDDGGWEITDFSNGRVYWLFASQGKLLVFEESNSLFSFGLPYNPAMDLLPQIPPADVIGLMLGVDSDLRQAFCDPAR